MTSLYGMRDGEMTELKGRLSRAGLTAELALAINRDAGIAGVMVEAAEEYLNKNPFVLSIPEILVRFRKANEQEGWGFGEEIFAHLAATVPAWPKGRDTFLSLRVRWGEGRDGVIETFERHSARIRNVFGEEKFWRWEYLLSGEHPYKGELVDRLKLHAGNGTHYTVVEWVIVDLAANRERESVIAVRGSASLADEGLAIAWLYPERVQAIEYDKYSAWFCAGYELDVPESDGESWRSVPLVHFFRSYGMVGLSAHWRSGDHPGYSVPVARECQP